MSYIHYLMVHKYRVRVGVAPSNLIGASALSAMDLNYITETITELNQVIAGQLSDLSWVHNSFASFPKVICLGTETMKK